jgi:hypothetical protein
MATAAQIAANRRNAEKSTGPRTPEGKAHTSQNAVTFGLYGRHDSAPGETEAQDLSMRDALLRELAPSGALEESLAAEILRACRRLDRCALADFQISTGPVNDLCDCRQPGIERARVAAERSRDRAIAQLRRLQTERALRQTYSKADLPELPGLAEQSQVVRGIPGDHLWKLLTGTAADHKREGMVRREMLECELDLAKMKVYEQAILNSDRARSKIAEQSQFPQSAGPSEPAPVSRNSPCPCGSGLKHKRCCGRFAAPILAVAGQPRQDLPLRC